jgi:hypothetical protein
MPLLDHFHPPLSTARHWEGFHARLAASIADILNRELPPDYFAEAQVHVGSRVEVDVATFEQETPGSIRNGGTAAPGDGGTLTATAPSKVWTPPAAAWEMPAVYPDAVEVLVFSTEAGPTLVSAVELVSPSNKDRREERRAFAAKCASYLQQGIGLMVVDFVTNRHANLHNELIDLLELGTEFLLPPEPLYAVAYRPSRRQDGDRIQVWPAGLSVGQPLPLLPLALNKGICLPLNLEAAYKDACQSSRLP